MKYPTPVFFLTSTEARPTLEPRECRIIERLWSDERQNYFLRIGINPSILGRLIGVEQDSVDDVVIAARHAGINLYPMSDFPITVYVCYIVNPTIRDTGRVIADDLHIILIGEIYRTLKDAERAIKHEKRRI